MARPVGAKHLEAILAVGMAVAMCGCVLKGNPSTASVAPPAPKPVAAAPAAPPPPPPPLSTPQTRIELPAPQPLSADAQQSTEPSGEPPAPPPSPPKKKNATPRPRPADATPAPATPPATPPAAAPAAAEPEPRAPIQEIIPADELNRLRANANAKKEEIRQRLEPLRRRSLTKTQKELVDTITSFLRLSEEAERSGDMRKANEFAERGAVLAQGLPGGR